MLERVDAHEGDVSKVGSADYRRIVDLCWQCKLCFNHCPYTPPHRFDIDFPRLMLRSKAARAAAEGVSWQDRWLGEHRHRRRPRLRHRPPRQLGQRRRAPRARPPRDDVRHRASTGRCPASTTRPSAGGSGSAAAAAVAEGHNGRVLHTCVVNYNEPQVGRDAVSVLEKNGCAVSCPEGQVCCGMPYLDGGDIEAARANARRNVDALLPLVKAGADVIVTQPTCSYVLKKEYPLLLPGPDTDAVAARTFDTFEFLVARHQEGHLSTEFPGRSPGKVAYQAPCHLRAQNMGYKTRDVLQLIPGTRVTVVERCTAMDGTWGMKKEFYPISLQFARRAAEEMEAAQPDTYTTDCSLAALQIADVRGAAPAPSRRACSAKRTACPKRDSAAMRKVDLAEIKDLVAYEKVRGEMRARVIEVKKHRRVAVGPNLTLLFENRDTVLFQIQEMVRTERIVDDRKLQDEVDVYNALVPDARRALGHAVHRDPRAGAHEPGRRSARPSTGSRASTAAACGSSWAAAGCPPCSRRATAKEEKMAAVHYVRFQVPEAARRALADSAADARLVVEHPHYRAQATLTPDTRRALQEDLAD